MSPSKRKAGRTGGMEAKLRALDRRMDDGVRAIEEKLDNAEHKMNRAVQRMDEFLNGAPPQPDRTGPLLAARGLKKYFPLKRTSRLASMMKTGPVPVLRAVDGIDLDIRRGETLSIVGESGCGKSTAARVLIGLTPPTAGSVTFDGVDLFTGDRAQKKELRRRMNIVFQDPYGSLDPRMTVADIVGEPLLAYHMAYDRTEMMAFALEAIESCGLQADDLFKFPHQFSGGQRQRICIARALAARPDLVVCDEAVSALDVSIQAQIINLLCDLREQRGLTYLFISHDLEVVRFLSDRVAVMYLGKIMEIAPKGELFSNPLHPYTIALLESAPEFGRETPPELSERQAALLAGDIPTAVGELRGCRFQSRCPSATPECRATEPLLLPVSPEHYVACHQVKVTHA